MAGLLRAAAAVDDSESGCIDAAAAALASPATSSAFALAAVKLAPALLRRCCK
jgi:hypothetical protein